MLKYHVMELIREFLSLDSIKKLQQENKEGKAIESYLFHSPDSFTNKNYAIAVGVCFLCQNGACLDCPDCLKIISGVHPDVLSFPEGKSLAVSDAKKIIEETTQKPMLTEKKVIIINDIDNSSDEAQNKLLKIIEEPPKNVIFIATASNMDKVLATIKSRMQKRQIEKFKPEHIEKMLEENVNPFKELAIIKGDGYIGTTLNILSDDSYFDLYNKAKKFVFNIKNSSQILENVSDKLTTREQLKQIINHMSCFYSDILMCKAGYENGVENKFEKANYLSIKEEFSLSSLVEIQKLINNALRKIQANGNANLILETLLVKILEVKYLCK